MAIQIRSILKGRFSRGKYPLEEQFADWPDSFLHKTEDTMSIANVESPAEQLNAKYAAAQGQDLEQEQQAFTM